MRRKHEGEANYTPDWGPLEQNQSEASRVTPQGNSLFEAFFRDKNDNSGHKYNHSTEHPGACPSDHHDEVPTHDHSYDTNRSKNYGHNSSKGVIGRVIDHAFSTGAARKEQFSGRQQSILSVLRKCYHNELGYISKNCASCGLHEFLAHTCCNNRHCPDDGAKKREEWAAKVQERLPHGRYFQVVFTIPHEFNSLCFCESNKRVIFDAIMKASMMTLKQFSAESFGGDAFILSVLHTWDQVLKLHIHTHCLISANFLSEKDGKWREAKDFLFQQQALAKVFRAIFLRLLEAAINARDPDDTLYLRTEGEKSAIGSWYEFNNALPTKWHVYVGKPMKTHCNVIRYFARYVNRTGITNSRVTSFDNKEVHLSPKRKEALDPEKNTTNNNDNQNRKEKANNESIIIPLDEFVQRFVQHFLPKNFHRVRYAGLASPSSKVGRELAKARKAAKAAAAAAHPPQPARCTHCQGNSVWLVVIRISPSTGHAVTTRKRLYESSA